MHTAAARISASFSPGGDLDPVGVADPEPALGDLGDGVAVTLDLVLMIDEVALGAEVATILERRSRTGRATA